MTVAVVTVMAEVNMAVMTEEVLKALKEMQGSRLRPRWSSGCGSRLLTRTSSDQIPAAAGAFLWTRNVEARVLCDVSAR